MVRIDDVLSPYYNVAGRKTTEMMSPAEFHRRTVSSGKPAQASSISDEGNIVEGNISPTGLWPDEKFETKEELYIRLAEKYDMENLNMGDITRILATLSDAGILDQSEFLPACGPIPVFSLDAVGAPIGTPLTNWDERPVTNALAEYKKKYADYINTYCRNVDPSTAATLQKALAVHNKVDRILHEIQSYRK